MKGTIKIAVGAEGKAYRVREIPASIFGAWAAHEDTTVFQEYVVTCIPFGLAAPFQFETLKAAKEAAREIDALRDDWDGLSGDEVLAERDAIVEICERHGGVRKPSTPSKPVPISELERPHV